MPQPFFTPQLLAELKVLGLFNSASQQEGIKVHSSADQELVEATGRLYDKGLITQSDGGYLTTLGQDAAEHARDLAQLLDGRELTT
ncbi:TIGR02647 family protein [Halomonas halocynthiae]|uniref:TIGR02647 family protein n=1 Tax=Halomonas halocynthiae TaxID=176290 RepID=UPI000406EA56|nr:TIGR02647 family protein [Halomonas halocynthiae]